jgi:hypothetical protein
MRKDFIQTRFRRRNKEQTPGPTDSLSSSGMSPDTMAAHGGLTDAGLLSLMGAASYGNMLSELSASGSDQQ